MWPYPQFPEDFVTFYQESLMENFIFWAIIISISSTSIGRISGACLDLGIGVGGNLIARLFVGLSLVLDIGMSVKNDAEGVVNFFFSC